MPTKAAVHVPVKGRIDGGVSAAPDCAFKKLEGLKNHIAQVARRQGRGIALHAA